MTRAEHAQQKARVIASEMMQPTQTARHGTYARRVRTPARRDREAAAVNVAHAIQQVTDRYHALPAAVHTESPRSVLSRVAANAFWTRTPTHERALNLAALAVALLIAIERAETMDITSGNEAA